MTPLTYGINGLTLAEMQIATEAVESFRKGIPTAAKPGAWTSASQIETAADLAEKAILNFPSNPQKKLLQRLLFEAPEAEWVAFDSIKTAFTEAGLKASQASAALRDLSWQIGQVFPPEAVANLDANIGIIAERMRSGGSFNYRLTEIGRAAIGRVLKN